MSELATATTPHLFWIASRAAGVAALILASVSVCVGLLMSGRLRRSRGAELRVAHEALSLATLTAIAVHGLSLLGDSYLHPSLLDVSLPLAGSYETFWTSAGIVSSWLLAALGLSYYARVRIGVQRWRKLHRLAALAWLLGLAHSLGEGSDAGTSWFLAMAAIAVLPPMVLLLSRWLQRSGAMPPSIDSASSNVARRPPAQALWTRPSDPNGARP